MSDAIESKIMVQGQTGKMRAAIANAARSLAVKGKIEELGDGSIEVTAQGRKEAVEALVKKLREMPGLDTVNVLQTIPQHQAKQGFLSFRA
ncbi:MAG: acylphosphatase [Candidatus Micrarchaeia archaeon]|jgi:acylphosphatase